MLPTLVRTPLAHAAPPPAMDVPADRHGIWTPGVRAFRQLRFHTKAAIISLVFAIPMLLIVAWLLQTQFNNAMQERMDATRQHVEIVHGILRHVHAQEAAGQINRETAQKLALDLIEPLRYDSDEYFWINDLQPRMVMHPITPQLNGKDMSDMRDPNGFAVFKAFADAGRGGGKGFVQYQWPKPGQEEPVDKISYVYGFAPWGWVLGSGVYVEDIQESVLQSIIWTAIGVIVSGMVAAYFFLSFYRVMDGGLRETRRHLRAIAAGDLTTSPVPMGRDEAAQLLLELRQMQDALRAMVSHVRHTSNEIVHSAKEIADGASDLSRRTEHTASNLEESAASMEEISATVSHSAQHTQDAAEMARRNADTAIDGGRVMREVVDTMEGIRGASTKISEIISTIDGIAFQTNILALNAAVEAARAGNQGRGFAVVAAEVRSLAQRSASAAKEIKTLIDDSVARIATGATVVRNAGTTIEEIVTSSQRINQLLDEIAHGAREQELGVQQIGVAVGELDRMTQDNAALVEQTAAATTSLEDQADQLVREVSRFRLP